MMPQLCPECRALVKAYRNEGAKRYRERRAVRLAADPTLAAHGTWNTYANWNCRCPECRAAATAYVGRHTKDPA